jgi:drug/metabolite transporter (DMT)-like permease
LPEGLLPVVLSLGAGVLFAFGTHFLSLGLRYADPQTGTLIDIGGSAVMYWLLAPFFLEAGYWITLAALIFVILGLFRPFITANLATRGVYYLGPTLSATFSSTAPFFAAGFGVLLLDENLTLPIGVGTLAIIAAVGLLSYRGGVKASWPLWALLFPLGAALLRSASHTFTKIGLEMVPSPFFAALVGTTVSFALALAAQRFRRLPPLRFKTNPGLLWFVAAGVAHGLAVLVLNSALAIGQVIVVVPLISAYPFFTLALSLLVFRRESVNRRTVIAVLLVVPGALLIALSR